jgi:hypothetical protein
MVKQQKWRAYENVPFCVAARATDFSFDKDITVDAKLGEIKEKITQARQEGRSIPKLLKIERELREHLFVLAGHDTLERHCYHVLLMKDDNTSAYPYSRILCKICLAQSYNATGDRLKSHQSALRAIHPGFTELQESSRKSILRGYGRFLQEGQALLALKEDSCGLILTVASSLACRE